MRFHSEYNAYSLTEVQSVIFCDKFARKRHRLVVNRILSRAKAKNGTETKNTSKWQIMLLSVIIPYILKEQIAKRIS